MTDNYLINNKTIKTLQNTKIQKTINLNKSI